MADFPRTIEKSDDSRKNWREINKLTDLVKQLQTEVHRLSSGVTDLRLRPQFKEGGEGGSTVQRFYVLAHEDDYLHCQRLDGNGSGYGPTVNIAKPPSLRVIEWQGLTVGDWSYTGTKAERVATYVGTAVPGGLQPGDQIGEILHPPYEAEVELVASIVNGGTKVVVVAGEETEQLTWIDLNADARRFVSARDRVDVCKLVNGVETPKRMVLDGGPVF